MSTPKSNSSKDIARLAVRGTVWVTLSQYLTIAVGFAANLVLTRLLTPEIFGVFALGMFWLGVLGLRAKAGLNYAALRQTELSGDLLGTYAALELGLALMGVAVSGLAGVGLVAGLGYAPEVAYVLVGLSLGEVLMALNSPLALATEREMMLGRPGAIWLAANMAAYAVVLGLAWAGAGVWSLVAVNLITYSLMLVGMLMYCRQRVPHIFALRWGWSANLARTLFREGLPTGLSLTAVLSVSNQYDNFMVGTFLNTTTLGFYDRAFRMAHWSNMVLTTVVGRVGYLTFTKVKDDLPRLTHAVRLGLWVLTTLGLPFTLIIIFAAPDLVSLLYGPAWAQSAIYLPFIAFTALILPVHNLAFWLATALGQQKAASGLFVAQAVAIVVLVTPLTLTLGMAGTLAGVAGAATLAGGLSYAYIFRQLPLTWRETLLPPLIAAALTASVLAAVVSWPPVSTLAPWVRLMLVAGLAPTTYLLTIWAAARAETQERLRYLLSTWRPATP